jgi:hypothetical protein
MEDIVSGLPEARVGLQKCRRKIHVNKEILDSFVEGLPNLRQVGLQHRKVPASASPQDELRVRILPGESSAVEQHREKGQANRAAHSGPQGACGRPQAPLAPSGPGELDECRFDVGRQVHEVAGTITIVELEVPPQVFEHPCEVRLAAAIEAGDPHGWLLCFAQVR